MGEECGTYVGGFISVCYSCCGTGLVFETQVNIGLVAWPVSSALELSP